jgi:hypothetical protein
MRPPGIEPGLVAWEATVIPLDHGRISVNFLKYFGANHKALLPINPYAFAAAYYENITFL